MTNRGNRPESGLILHRGGEELLLSRVGDRFTTRLTEPTAVEEVRSLITPLAIRPVAQGQLVEWQVGPERLEDTLAAARQVHGCNLPVGSTA